jgi:hypothetical protein
MLERDYQAQLIRKLRRRLPGCIILKNDTDYLQGIPDLTILYGDKWAMLEVKASRDAPNQPNQVWYVCELNDMSFAAFIYPAIEEEVLDALQQTFGVTRTARISKRKQVPLDQLRR